MANFRVTIEHNRSGTYQIRKVYKDGTRETAYGGVVGRMEARKLAERVKDRWLLIEKGECDSDQDIRELIPKFIEDKRNDGKEPGTLEHYSNSMRAFLDDKPTAVVKIRDLTRDTIKDWIGTMRGQKLKGWSIYNRLSDLRTFLTWCVENKYLPVSPFAKVMPEKPARLPRFWSDAEFWALDEALKTINRELYLACRFMFFAGLRFSESIAVFGEDMRWMQEGDVEALIWRSIHRSIDNDHIGTKTNKPRTIPLSPFVIELLGSRRTGRLTPSLTYDNGHHFFKRARDAAKINPKLTMHGLRHSFCKNYLQLGLGNLRSLMELTGHQDIKMMEIYAHFEQDFQRQVISRIYVEMMKSKAASGVTCTEILQANYRLTLATLDEKSRSIPTNGDQKVSKIIKRSV